MPFLKDLLNQDSISHDNIQHVDQCGRTGYTGPTGRTGPCPSPSDPTAYCTYTALAQLLASSSLLVEVYPTF